MTIVEPEMGVWPMAAPDKEETVTMEFEEGTLIYIYIEREMYQFIYLFDYIYIYIHVYLCIYIHICNAAPDKEETVTMEFEEGTLISG